MADPCAVCARNADCKMKPGIFPCNGCKQMFCTQHVVVHRQELANELDLVIGERNELQEILDRSQDILDASVQINLLDEWEKKTIEQVHKVADDMRQRVIHLIEEQKDDIKVKFADLTKQLDTFRENENFYEKDIENLKEQFLLLKSLLNTVNTNITVTDVSSSLIQAVNLQETVQAVNSQEIVQAVTLQETEKSLGESSTFIEDLLKNKTPYKQIKIPHKGNVQMGENFALVFNNNDCTMIDLDTDSLRSISIDNSRNLTFYWSTHLGGFLAADTTRTAELMLFKKDGPNLKNTWETRVTFENVQKLVCFTDRLMLVCYGMSGDQVIEEWCLKGQC